MISNVTRVLPTPIDISRDFVGVSPKTELERNTYLYRLNETNSLDDEVFPDGYVKAQKAPSMKKLVMAYDDMIEQHCEKRVTIFFLQLIACFGTKLEFSIGKTEDQAQSSTSLYFKNKKGEEEIVSKRNSAHSSILPCLVVSSKKADKEVVFIKNSEIYRGANTTLSMLREINEGDILLENAFREKALALINLASQGKLSPRKGIEVFLEKMLKILPTCIEKAQKPGVEKSLELTEKHLKRIYADIREDHTILLKIMQIDEKQTSPVHVREKIYQLRYAAIQNCQLAQSEIIQKIKNVFHSVQKKFRSRPFFLQEAFQTMLIEEAKKHDDHHRIEKLLNSPQDAYFASNKSSQTKLTNTLDKLEKHRKIISQFADDLHVEFRRLKRQEIFTRGAVLCVLRESYELTHAELSKKILAQYPNAIASKSTLQRIEKGELKMNPTLAKQLSQVFRIDPVLFMPSFFFS